MIVNKSVGTFIVAEVNEILWDKADDNWDTFYADSEYTPLIIEPENDYYAQYLRAEYGIIVPPPYEMLWDHAIILTIGFPSGYEYTDQQREKDHRQKKNKVKLIFIIDDLEKVFIKEKNNQVKVEFKDTVENILTERFGQKVILENVQIIHR